MNITSIGNNALLISSFPFEDAESNGDFYLSPAIFTFPAGETHAILPSKMQEYIGDPKKHIIFAYHAATAQNHIELIALANAMSQKAANSLALVLPYLPYSRADRVGQPGECFGLQFFLNSLQGNRIWNVFTLDQHSPYKTPFYNIENIIPRTEIRTAIEDFEKKHGHPILLFPDAGAYERYQWLEDSGYIMSFASKKRDYHTGALSGFVTPRLEGPVLIIDDICDGGGTFLGIHQSLTRYNRSKNLTLGLYTTHGIYSKGIDVLKNNGYTNIYSTDSFPNTITDPCYKKISCYTSIKEAIRKMYTL